MLELSGFTTIMKCYDDVDGAPVAPPSLDEWIDGLEALLGKAEAGADISLEDIEGGTILAFTARAGADGGIMKLGRAIVGNSAQKVIDGFFERFGRAMGAELTVLPLSSAGQWVPN